MVANLLLQNRKAKAARVRGAGPPIFMVLVRGVCTLLSAG